MSLGIPDLGDAYKKMIDLDKVKSQVNNDTPKNEYKYSEDIFILNLHEHVKATYSKHYGGIIQPVEFIMSNATTLDYLKGNVIKYIYRFGKKNGSNPEDLYKAVHFMMMMLHYKDKK